jgi:hypothetical protein
MRNEYKTTTNSRVYKILHKETHASCSYCPWHSRWFGCHNENDCWKNYYRDSDDDYTKQKKTLPNWKLVSKNRKQWMKKPLKYIHRYHCAWDDTDSWRIEW